MHRDKPFNFGMVAALGDNGGLGAVPGGLLRFVSIVRSIIRDCDGQLFSRFYGEIPAEVSDMSNWGQAMLARARLDRQVQVCTALLCGFE
jgi:hypothetical protein